MLRFSLACRRTHWSLSMMPTSSALTRMLSGANSFASALVSAIPAARLTEVGAEVASGALAPMLSTLMMRPQRRARIPGSTARDRRMAANSFRSRSDCQKASVCSRKGPRWDVPALLIRMSTAPAASAARAQPSTVPTSAAMAMTRAPGAAAVIVASALASASAPRATMATAAPALAKAVAIARPRPLEPPVMSAVRPLRSLFMELSLRPACGSAQREWGDQRGSNPRHPAPQADALPTELWPPHGAGNRAPLPPPSSDGKT